MNSSGLNIVFANSTLCFPKFSAFSKSTLRISNLSRKDDASLFASPNLLLQPTLWSTRSEGSRIGIPQRRNVFSVPAKEDKSERSSSSTDHESSKSSGQEEIIALFKRIQASIAKDGPTSTQKRSSTNYKEKTTKRSSRYYKETPSSQPVLDVLHQPSKRGKVRTMLLPQRRGGLKKETRAEDNSPMPNFKLTRLPSNFVKRSPIPAPSIREGQVIEVIGEQSPNAVSEKELELQRVEEMKLPELKLLAKSRGIKGYSKLKKGELVELLKGL